jgi:hypothetical protein
MRYLLGNSLNSHRIIQACPQNVISTTIKWLKVPLEDANFTSENGPGTVSEFHVTTQID